MNRAIQRFFGLQAELLQDNLVSSQLDSKPLSLCPTSASSDVSMNDLLFVLRSAEIPRGALKRFATECSQCGLCAYASRDGVRLDKLALELKRRIKDKPKQYAQAVALQGDIPLARQLQRRAAYLRAKKSLGDLYPLLDKVPKSATLLFFAGEHMLLDAIGDQWHAISHHAKNAHIMGGLRLASGYDQFVQGDTDAFVTQFEKLIAAFNQASPSVIITPTRATFWAAHLYVTLLRKDCHVVSLAQWISGKMDLKTKVALYHDPQFLRMTGYHLSTLLGKQAIDIDPSHQQVSMAYNYNVDAKNAALRHGIIAAAAQQSDTLVVDCAYTADLLRSAMGKGSTVRIFDIGAFLGSHLEGER